MNEKRNRIAFRFNLALFCYLSIGFFVSLIFEPEIEEKVLWDTVFIYNGQGFLASVTDPENVTTLSQIGLS